MYDVRDILSLMPTKNEEDRNLVTRAFNFAEIAHEGDRLPSGNPYLEHPFECAKILASAGVDAKTIACALLHDVVDQSGVSREEVASEFGRDMVVLIDDVTNLSKLTYQGTERYVESLQKLFVAMSHDVRTILVKFAGRIHNMRTIEFLSKEDQKRIATETLDLYAPLAERLGMRAIRGELQDLAFKHVYPREYVQTKKLFESRSKEARERLEKIYRHLQKRLSREDVGGIKVEYRIKYLYSLYRKLEKYDMDIEKIYDIQALRIIVPSLSDCYRVLGVIHDIWTPVPGRIKDYIAIPKPNGYQSLHTTIFTGDGSVAEIQIRTEDMHREAEYGIASHVTYSAKEKSKQGPIKGKELIWVKRLLEWQKHASDSEDLWQEVVLDLFRDKIFVFSPKGDVFELPEDSTPVDFAYAIHSEIGDHAQGAIVNEKYVALNSKLHNSDVVNILTKKASAPNQKWLEFVKTSLARKQIRSAIKKQRRKIRP